MILNNELKLPVPEGFHVMDEEEVSRLRLLEEGPFAGLSDPERHMMITVGWKRLGSLTALMVNAGDVARHTEKTIHRAMAQMGYHCEGFRERQIAGAGAAVREESLSCWEDILNAAERIEE